MQAFSNTVAELYERAADASPGQFLTQAMQLVSRLIRFDGAILGFGNADITLAKNIAITKACVNRPGESIQDKKIDVTVGNLIVPAYIAHSDTPTVCSLKDMESRFGTQWYDFAHRHGMHQLMAYGDPSSERNARWIMLYRREEPAFQDADAQLLHALWRHFEQATAFNLRGTLYRSDPHRVTRVMALVNSCGLIEAIDTPMIELLKLEWPDFDERRLPPAIASLLFNSGTYYGKCIELTGFQKFGYMACSAKPVRLTKSLTPSETNVARLFARGMTHKEIAARLNVSPYTVRNQIAQVYMKLGVHGKAELAHWIYGMPATGLASIAGKNLPPVNMKTVALLS